MKLRSYLAPLMIASTLLWAAPAFAQTACNATNYYTFDWNSQPLGSINENTTHNYTVNNGAGGPPVTMSLTFGGDLADLGNVNFGGALGVIQTPYIGIVNTGGIGATQYTLTLGTVFDSRQSNIDSNNDVVFANFAFSTPVREVRFTTLDVDFTSGQFRDWIKVYGRNGANSYVPGIVTPYGNNNTTNPGQTAPGIAFVGPFGGTPGFGNQEVVGNGASGSTQDFGNFTTTFTEPVTSIQIRYANGPNAYTSGTPGQQALSIYDISFCPMPVINVIKSSASFDTSGPERFNIPDTDVVYTLRVENNGGSTVDADEIDVSDILPPEVTYFNGDYNGAAAGTSDFEFIAGTSGLTLPPANVTYSDNGGVSYTYNPNGSYDATVDAVQFQPVGTMAANSFFEIRFRARIN